LRGQGTTATLAPVLSRAAPRPGEPGISRGAAATMRLGGTAWRREPRGPRPAVTVILTFALGSPAAAKTARTAALHFLPRRRYEADDGSGALETLQVAAQGEGAPVLDKDALEHTVAVDQPVVEDRDHRLGTPAGASRSRRWEEESMPPLKCRKARSRANGSFGPTARSDRQLARTDSFSAERLDLGEPGRPGQCCRRGRRFSDNLARVHVAFWAPSLMILDRSPHLPT